MRRPALRRWSWARFAAGALALAALVGPGTREAMAVAPVAWRDTLYSFRTDGEVTLSEALTHFTSTLGLELKFDDSALGRRAVRLTGKGASPSAFLDRLADAQGLDWFVHQGVLHVSARASAVNERISLGPQNPSEARDALIGIGLFESRFGWGEFNTDPPTALVSGPRAYVALVKRALAAPDDAHGRQERPRLMVFRLRHASAADREMRTREKTVALPGLVSTLNQLLTSTRALNPRPRAADAEAGGGGRDAAAWRGGNPLVDLIKGVSMGDKPLDAGLGELPAARLPLPTPAPRLAGPGTAASAPIASTAGPSSQRGVAGIQAEDEFMPSIAAYTPLNAVLVWDLPSRQSEYRALIDELDVPTRLVEINVTILDVKANALRDWSVDLSAGSGAAHLSLNAGGHIGTSGGGGGTGVSGSTMVLWASDRLAVRLRALETRGQAQVLSRPSVLTMNNVGALLDMNQSAYVKLVGERATDLRTITAGTLLKVTPSIVGDAAAATGAEGIRVTLDIEDGQLTDGAAASGAPGVSNSAVSTEAVVRPGESLVVGGYRRQDRQVINKRVPGLSSIPLLGALFRGDTALHDERERLFILTARALP